MSESGVLARCFGDRALVVTFHPEDEVVVRDLLAGLQGDDVYAAVRGITGPLVSMVSFPKVSTLTDDDKRKLVVPAIVCDLK